MRRFLVPQIARADLPAMLKVAAIGGLVAGVYGMVHDQVTYSISPEYFTRLKFPQFWYADFGLGDRVFVATIGFLAASWAGFAGAWFLARQWIPNQAPEMAFQQIVKGCALVLGSTLLGGLIGNSFGVWIRTNAHASDWSYLLAQLKVTDRSAFIRVAYIHYGGYLGALIGLVLALVAMRPMDGASTKLGATR